MTTTSTVNGQILIEKARIFSIDIVRGLVMVVMALDHTRDFFHIDANVFSPTDLTRTTPVLFFTRWITHYCAPTFVFLSGVSIFINQQRKSKKDLSIFLLTRGLWLLVLEFTVIRFGIVFNLYYDVVIFQVIWAIGVGMIMLSGMTHLPFKVIAATGVIIVFGHDLLHLLGPATDSPFGLLYALSHGAGNVQVTDHTSFMIMYPVIPWLGIMLLGYSIGSWYSKNIDARVRQKLLLRTGLLAVGLFILIRLSNLYGDPSPWQVQDSALITLLSFLNVSKYPPSLMYTLMTLGPVLLLLAWLERRNPSWSRSLVHFGRVPMLYYILHFYLIHLLAVVMYIILADKSISQVDFHFTNSMGGVPFGYGYSLGIVYLVWMLVVISLYPVCKKYNQYKSTHKDWWLSYL